MKKKIDIKNNMYYAIPEDSRHIWRVKFNPANGVYFIKNKRNGKEYQHLAAAFVCGNPGHRNSTNNFPGYVHGQVWLLDEYHFSVRLDTNRAKYLNN